MVRQTNSAFTFKCFSIDTRNVSRGTPDSRYDLWFYTHICLTDIEQYMLGVLAQVNTRKMDLETITVDEFMVFRRSTVAAMPCMALVESVNHYHHLIPAI